LAGGVAARQAAEDEQTETEDDDLATRVLDRMVDQLGVRKEVDRDIEEMHRNQDAAQQGARFANVDEDGNGVMMTRNATRGFGASSRDANYRDNVRRLIGGGREKGHCAVAKCQHPEMELLHKCNTCKRYVHILCSMANNLQGEDDEHYCSRTCKR
jgi:hypothetical protein